MVKCGLLEFSFKYVQKTNLRNFKPACKRVRRPTANYFNIELLYFFSVCVRVQLINL